MHIWQMRMIGLSMTIVGISFVVGVPVGLYEYLTRDGLAGPGYGPAILIGGMSISVSLLMPVAFYEGAMMLLGKED